MLLVMLKSALPLVMVSSTGDWNELENCGNWETFVNCCESWFVCSYSTCQNARFLMKGPPARPPNCWRSKGGFFVLGEVLSRRWSADQRASRKKPKAEPWKSLVPLRVMMFTAPAEVMSVLGSKVDCDTWNSWIDSFETFVTVVPTVSSVMSTPST